MPRETLDRQIRHLLNELFVLSSMVENNIIGSVEALKQRDQEAARRIYAEDRLVNKKRFEIENACIATIATQQPIMAGDLRLLASILDVTTEVERMGDYSKGIAKICQLLGNEPLIKPLIDIPRMAELAVSMLHRAISAFVDRDLDVAQDIPKEDDLVDSLYNQVYRELVMIMFTNPSTIDQANYLMWVAHNLERTADRVTNICERTIYVQTGKLAEIDTSDDETNNSHQMTDHG
jgi:phosphate transport system protein